MGPITRKGKTQRLIRGRDLRIFVWTVGLGTIWGKNEIGAKLFQVDLGASFADDVTNVVLSGIFRF